jgi:hypothetical protein
MSKPDTDIRSESAWPVADMALCPIDRQMTTDLLGFADEL